MHHRYGLADQWEAKLGEPVTQSIIGININSNELAAKLDEVRADQPLCILNACRDDRANHVSVSKSPAYGEAGDFIVAHEHASPTGTEKRGNEILTRHSDRAFVKGLYGLEIVGRCRTNVVISVDRRHDGQNRLMLMHHTPGLKAAPTIQGQPLFGRIEKEVSSFGGFQQRVEKPRSKTAALHTGRYDNHASRGEPLSVAPPQSCAENFSVPFQNYAFSNLSGELPVLQPVRPGEFLGQFQSAFEVPAIQLHQRNFVVVVAHVFWGVRHIRKPRSCSSLGSGFVTQLLRAAAHFSAFAA